ncbi:MULTISPECIES: hypothetical protein [Chryseobacterium]|uniref:hypothetical protein n=1 Tax=Chryseobacterium TaxID=59732 RepID=UPI001295BC7B|nr:MULTISPECIES: hypothetical protein [Chryseobacterium]MDR6920305.1 hypothetical protein [Chryseobacterium sp. 2987]
MKMIFAVSLLLSNLFFAQVTVPDDFKKIPDIMDNADLLYPFIIPDKSYEYWRVLRNDPDPDKAIIYDSQMPESMTINDPAPEKGFFQQCLGNACFSYILACKNSRTIYFSNEQQLRDFIGTVDNLPEALLLAKTYGFSVDFSNTLSSSYKIDNRHIDLYVSKPKNCPEVKESYRVKINRKTGKAEFKSNGIYGPDKECISSKN